MSFVLELQGLNQAPQNADPASTGIFSTVSFSLCSISTVSVVACLTHHPVEY
jgi:hypothetical protein